MKRYRVTIEFEAEDDHAAWEASDHMVDADGVSPKVVRVERASEYWAPVEPAAAEVSV